MLEMVNVSEFAEFWKIWKLEMERGVWNFEMGIWNFEMEWGEVCVGDRRLRLLDGTRADLLRLARFDRGAGACAP